MVSEEVPNCACGNHKAQPPDYKAAFNAGHSVRDQFIVAYLAGLRELVGRDFTDDENRGVLMLAEERWNQFSGGCSQRWTEQLSPLTVRNLIPKELGGHGYPVHPPSYYLEEQDE